MAVTTVPSRQHRHVGKVERDWPYVWLALREPPEPKPHHTVLIVSDGPVADWRGKVANDMIRMQKYDGTPFHSWRILAVFVQGELISGDPGPSGRGYPHFKVESR